MNPWNDDSYFDEEARCEYCNKILSKDTGEFDNGCLDCLGYVYLINDKEICVHCLLKEKDLLNEKIRRLQSVLNITLDIYQEFSDDDEEDEAFVERARELCK